MLTRIVQTSVLILSQTQGFSSQHPGFCSCAQAHSKYPHPIPDGAESTSLGLLHTYTQPEAILYQLLSQSNKSPSCTRNVTHQRDHLQEMLSPHMELPLSADRAPLYRTALAFHKPHLHRGRTASCRGCFRPKATSSFRSISHLPPALYCPSAVVQRCDMTAAHQRHTLQRSHRYQRSGPLLLPKRSWGALRRGLHHLSITAYITDFGHGRAPPAQQPDTPSS